MDGQEQELLLDVGQRPYFAEHQLGLANSDFTTKRRSALFLGLVTFILFVVAYAVAVLNDFTFVWCDPVSPPYGTPSQVWAGSKDALDQQCAATCRLGCTFH